MLREKLRDIVSGQNLFHVTPNTTVGETVKAMQKRHVGSALVLKDGKPCGIFTGSNFVEQVLDLGRDPMKTLVREVMTRDPVCLDCDRNGFEAVQLMEQNGIRHVVVRGAGETGYSILSVTDLPSCDTAEFENELEFERRLWEEL